MAEHIIIFIVFLAAVAYMGWVLYRSFMPNKDAGCAKGCGSCSAIDFSKLQKEIDRKQLKDLPPVKRPLHLQ